MLMMMCITLEVSTDCIEQRYSCFKRNRTAELKVRNKIITCPIRADILDVYSKLEKWIVVLADPVEICVMAWYLCKGHFAMKNEQVVQIL